MKKVLSAVEGIRRRLAIRMDAEEDTEQKNNKKNNKNNTKKHSAFSTRLPYGLCKDVGIDTTGMTPREAWDAYYGKTGISPDKVKAQKMGTDLPEEKEPEKPKGVDIGVPIEDLIGAGGLKEQEDGSFINPLTGEVFTKEQADEIGKRIEEHGGLPKKPSRLARIVKMSGGYDPEGLRDVLKDGKKLDEVVPFDSEEVAEECAQYFIEKGDMESAHPFDRFAKKAKARRQSEIIKADIDAISSLDPSSLEFTDRAYDIVESVPPFTELTLSGTPYHKAADGTWEKVRYGSKETANEDEVESALERSMRSAWEGHRPRVRVYSPTKLTKEDVADWYEELPTSVLAYDEIRDQVAAMPDGSAILTTGYSGGGKIVSFAYKKDGEWATFGGWTTGDSAPIRALSDAKYSDMHGSGIGSDCIMFPDDKFEPKKKPESDLDKKLTEKLKGDQPEVEKALRALKPGDKITIEVGDHSLEYERIKGGVRREGEWSKTEFSELARGLSGISGAKGISVTVTGVPRPKATPKTPEERAAAAERRAAREKIKAEMAKPFELSGAKYESPDTLSNFDKTLESRAPSIKSHYNLTDEDTDMLRKGFRKMFETHEYGMRFNAEHLQSILNTHFMNQMESKHSGGWHNEFGRARASRQLFGHEQQLDKIGIGGNGDSFEKYGYMPDDPIDDIENSSSAYWYGGVLATFKKDRVQSRTTYTCDDSLDEAGNPYTSPARVGEDPGWEGATCGNVKRTLQKFKDAAMTGKEVKPSEVAGSYLELQYHGRLTIDDVDALYFRQRDEIYLTDEVKQRLKDKGVRVYVVGRGWIQ